MDTIFSIFVGLAIYAFGYWLIGLPMARKGLEVWKKHYPCGNNGGFWGFVLFPMLSSEGNVGSICNPTFLMETGSSLFSPFDGERLEAEHKYITSSAAFWPLRIAYNLIAMAVVAFFAALGLIAMGLFVGVPALASIVYKAIAGHRAATTN